MSAVNTFLHRWTMRSIVQKFSDLASAPNSANRNRMRSLGLDDAMLDRVLSQMKTYRTTEKGLFTDKVTRLNLDAWDDLRAREAFTNAADRWARRIVQENDPGMWHRWFSHPVAKMLLQFRSFMLGAWSKQLLHNIHMRDWETFALFSGSMVWASIAYIAQTYAQSAGRSDRERFLEDRLSLSNVAKAGFQRAGFASIIPMAIDHGAQLAGLDPLFDYRTTGLPSDAFGGIPTIDLVFNRPAAFGVGLNRIFNGREMSQRELRDMNAVLPFQNFLPWQTLFSYMIKRNPEKSST